MRICRKTSGLKVVCNIYSLHKSTGTDSANLRMLTLTCCLPQPVPLTVVLDLMHSMSVCFPGRAAVWRVFAEYSLCAGEKLDHIAHYPSVLNLWNAVGKSFKTVYM